MYKKLMKKGFTLTEMMTVAVILSVLVAVALGSFRGSLERAKFGEGLQAAEAVAAAMSDYYYDNPNIANRMRPTLAELDVSFPRAQACASPDGYCVKIKNFEVTISGKGEVTAARKKGDDTRYSIIVFAPYMRTIEQQTVYGEACENGKDTETCSVMGYTTSCPWTNHNNALCKS